MLRPALSHLITSEFKHTANIETPELSPLLRRVLVQCAAACVNAAREAIEIIHHHRSRQTGDVGFVDAWWYNVLFLYSSATCLVAARLCKSVQTEVPEDTLLESWRKCMAVLHEYGMFNSGVRKLVATLSILFDAVPQQYGRFEEASQGSRGMEMVTTATPVAHMSSLGRDQDSIPPYVLPSEPNWLSEQVTFDTLGDFNFGFDPNDVSWLMSAPMGSTYS